MGTSSCTDISGRYGLVRLALSDKLLQITKIFFPVTVMELAEVITECFFSILRSFSGM